MGLAGVGGFGCGGWHLQPHVLVVLVLPGLVALVEFQRDHLLDAQSVLPRERVVLAVALVVHVVRPHEPSDPGVLVETPEFVALGVAVVFESDGVVGESA